MYRPTAAGHHAQEAPRSVEQGDISELVERAVEWYEKGRLQYDSALEMTQGINTTATAAAALAKNPILTQHPDYIFLGRFISALWNEHCTETTITYEHNTPNTDYLGSYLPDNKILVNNGTTCYYLDLSAKGILINNGKTRGGLGDEAAGIAIHNGKNNCNLGWCATGIIIATKPAIKDNTFKGTFISPEQYEQNTRLREYVDRLLKLSKHDPLAIPQELGDTATITAEIKKRIGGGA